jgi:hypothetical protein
MAPSKKGIGPVVRGEMDSHKHPGPMPKYHRLVTKVVGFYARWAGTARFREISQDAARFRHIYPDLLWFIMTYHDLS